jgi:phage baseplate assembly protein W
VVRDIGRDIFWEGRYAVTGAGDWVLANDVTAFRQSFIRRLSTSPGEYAAKPTYGIGAADFLYETMTVAHKAQLTGRIRDQLGQDPRVDKIRVIEVEQLIETDVPSLRIRIEVQLKGQIVVLKPFIVNEEGVS